MTDLQELMAMPECWRTEAKHDVECGFHSAGAARRICADELETILHSPAFADMAANARRYEWLMVAERMHSGNDDIRKVYQHIDENGGRYDDKQSWDAAIDAAASGGG